MPGIRRCLVLCRKNGQLGNRLMVHAHLLAAARERGWALLNPTFGEYSDDFEGTRGRSWHHQSPQATTIEVRISAGSAWRRGLAYAATRVLYQSAKVVGPLSLRRVARLRARNAKHVDLGDALPPIESAGTQLLLLQGYHFRHAPWAQRHAEYLRRYFRPIASHREPAESRVDELRRQADVIVGMHIRHGDYALHLDGKFFYPVTQYRAWMDQLVRLLAPARVGFLICSNAQHQDQDFAGLTHARGPGGVISDLHALSRCDLVLGPPSSYSSWAAFAGGCRLLRMEDPQRPLALVDFVAQQWPETLH